MTVNEYLASILKAQTLSRDSTEAKTMQAKRDEIYTVLKERFGDEPRMYWAGSYGKHTMVRASYDVDIVFYHHHDVTTSVEQINKDVEAALVAKGWHVYPQDVALRLQPLFAQYHIDVVPGRAIDDTFKEAYLWRRKSSCRLKTSVKTHIDAVSSRRDIIKLMKLWKLKHNVNLKTFILELSVLQAVKGKSTTDLEVQMNAALRWLRDEFQTATLVDPANTNNVVSNDLTWTERLAVALAASQSLIYANTDWRWVV